MLRIISERMGPMVQIGGLLAKHNKLMGKVCADTLLQASAHSCVITLLHRYTFALALVRHVGVQ
jgi:hypothetical protein